MVPRAIRVGLLVSLAVAAAAPGAAAPAPAPAASAGPLDAALRRLRTHEELRRELTLLEWLSRGRLQAGPLVRNGGRGLVDIDGAVADALPSAAGVCGAGAAPSIREAVACTVEPGGPGNGDPTRIGRSTQGRELLAARLGTPGGLRVVFLTQQHGNEVASTEAAMNALWELALSDAPWVRRALRSLDLLFVLRANPDGGEPGKGCAVGPFDVGGSFPQDCAITRWNVDPRAGVPAPGAASSEPGFFGIVGQGYDLNRYHFAALDGPIRPVETQALVAAMLAFRPAFLIDLHGDVVKTTCAVVPASVVVDPQLGLPFALECAGAPGAPRLGPSPVGDLVALSVAPGRYPAADPRGVRARALLSRAARQVEALGAGRAVRFSQLAMGVGVLGNDAERYATIGVATLTAEARNFSPSAVSLAVLAVAGGAPVVSFATGYPFDPAFVAEGVAIHRTVIASSLRTLTAFAGAAPASDGGYCALPAATGAIFTLPERFFGPNPFSASPALVPFARVPVQGSDDCPVAPAG